MVAVYDDEDSALGIGTLRGYSAQVVVFSGFFSSHASVPFFLQNFLPRGVPYGTYCCIPFFGSFEEKKERVVQNSSNVTMDALKKEPFLKFPFLKHWESFGNGFAAVFEVVKCPRISKIAES